MTSNLGASYIREKSESSSEQNTEALYEDIKEKVMDALKQNLRPEFLNRVDDIIVFHPLDKTHIQEIVKLQFKQIQKALVENGLHVQLSGEAVAYLAERGFDPAFGARPIKRLLQKEVVNELAKQLIAGELLPGAEITVLFRDGKIAFSAKEGIKNTV
jgi:ATP-dependent Clp protease ATP-binding subunit ClpB